MNLEGEKGVKNSKNLADVICEWPHISNATPCSLPWRVPAFKSRQAEDLETIDASLGSMSIGPRGNMHPTEIQVKTNNLVEVSTGRVERKCTPEKIFKYFIFMGCLLFILILVISLGLKHSGETETVKQCLAGYYNFPECISKYSRRSNIRVYQINVFNGNQ